MEKLAHSKNTPATDASFDLLGEIATDPGSEERYPDRTILIPADARDASALISRAIAEQRPMAVVFPDGSDFVARPPEAKGIALFLLIAALWLADRAKKSRDRPTFVPREWVTEFHRASQHREAQPAR